MESSQGGGVQQAGCLGGRVVGGGGLGRVSFSCSLISVGGGSWGARASCHNLGVAADVGGVC